jgi:hypothetical protein
VESKPKLTCRRAALGLLAPAQKVENVRWYSKSRDPETVGASIGPELSDNGLSSPRKNALNDPRNEKPPEFFVGREKQLEWMYRLAGPKYTICNRRA